MFCLRPSQIWSDLTCDRRFNMLWTDTYFNRVRAKVYQILASSKNNWIKQWRLVKANVLGMTACGSDWKKKTVCWR